MSDDARLAELEARFTLQEDLVEKLSREIFRQQREIDRLGARLADIEKRLAVGPGEAGEAPVDEKPPHY